MDRALTLNGMLGLPDWLSDAQRGDLITLFNHVGEDAMKDALRKYTEEREGSDE